jgi:hypothetical protein
MEDRERGRGRMPRHVSGSVWARLGLLNSAESGIGRFSRNVYPGCFQPHPVIPTLASVPFRGRRPRPPPAVSVVLQFLYARPQHCAADLHGLDSAADFSFRDGQLAFLAKLAQAYKEDRADHLRVLVPRSNLQEQGHDSGAVVRLRGGARTAIASNLSKDLLEVVLIPSSPEALVFRADRQALFLLQ